MDTSYVIDKALEDIAKSLRDHVEQQERLLALHDRVEAQNLRLLALREQEAVAYLASMPKREVMIALSCAKCGSTDRVTEYHSHDPGGRDCARPEAAYVGDHLHYACSVCGHESAARPLDWTEHRRG